MDRKRGTTIEPGYHRIKGRRFFYRRLTVRITSTIYITMLRTIRKKFQSSCFHIDDTKCLELTHREVERGGWRSEDFIQQNLLLIH